MGEHPRVHISEEIREVEIKYGQTLTLWFKEKSKAISHQVEVRITEDGKMEIFFNKNDSPIKVKDFRDWKEEAE